MKKVVILLAVLSLLVLGFGSVSAKEYKGEFRIGNGSEPETIDPHLASGVLEHRIHMSLFENLTAYDPKTAGPIPGLAKSWDVSADGTVYTFHLRKSTWSDGVAITAHDVVKSFLRVLDPKTAAPYAWFPSMFIKGGGDFNAGKAGPETVGVKAIDDLTFQLTLVGPLPYVLGALPHQSFSVVPFHVIEKHGKDWTLPENHVGNGPFKLESWKPQEKLTVVPNEKYWDAENVHLARVIYYPFDDKNTVHKMFLNGEIDWVDDIPLDQMEAALLRNDSYNAPYLGTYYYVFNCQKPPFHDPNVRKALSMSINREALTDMVTKAGEIPTMAMVPEMAGYKTIKGNKENIEKAQKLLAKAGFPGGKGFPKFTILYNTNEAHKKIAEYFQQQWKENLGVACSLENQEWKTYLASRRAHDFQVARAGWIGDYQDPNTFLDMFVAGGAMNGGLYTNPEFDKLINAAATESDSKKRMKMLRKAEQYFITQDQGVMPIYHYVSKGMVDKTKWGGWHVNTMNYHPPKNIFVK